MNWKMVPEDPTPEMMQAGLKQLDLALNVGTPEYDSSDAIELMWQAMLEAAPKRA